MDVAEVKIEHITFFSFFLSFSLSIITSVFQYFQKIIDMGTYAHSDSLYH